MLKKFIYNENNWWKIWGVLTPILLIGGIFIANVIDTSYIILLYEFLPPAFFGLWVYDKVQFKQNSIKLFILFLILFLTIYFTGYLATIIAPIIVLIIMVVLKFNKEQFLWSFGSMMLYGLLGFVVILVVLFIANPNITNEPQTIGYILALGSSLVSVLIGLVLKGILFGKVLEFFYVKSKR